MKSLGGNIPLTTKVTNKTKHTTWKSTCASGTRKQTGNITFLTSLIGNTKSLVSVLPAFSLTISLTPPHVKFIQGFSFMPAALRRLLWVRITNLKPERQCFRSLSSLRSVFWCAVWHRGALSHIILPMSPNLPPGLRVIGGHKAN